MNQLFDLRPLGQNQNVFSWTSLRRLIYILLNSRLSKGVIISCRLSVIYKSMLWGLVITYTSVNSLIAQEQPVYCGIESPQAFSLNSLNCPSSWICALPENGCENHLRLAPIIPSHTPVKKIRLILHIIQRSSGDSQGPRNFEDNETGHNWIDAMTFMLNIIYRNLMEPDNPVQECPTLHLQHSRIQFEVEKKLFHQNTIYWRTTATTGLWNTFVNGNNNLTQDQKENVLHIFLIHSTTNNSTAYVPGVGVGKYAVVSGYYSSLFESSTPDSG